VTIHAEPYGEPAPSPSPWPEQQLAVVPFFHAITLSDICHQQEAQSVNKLFLKRKQEVPQDKGDINRISMTVYFSLNVYRSSQDTYFWLFQSDF